MKHENKRNMKDIPINKILCRLLAAAAALVLLLTVIPGFGEGAETAGAPEQAAPSEYDLLLKKIRSRTPPFDEDRNQLINDLVPLNLSCEDNGIRLEIIAGAVKEQQALFIYSLEDLEGNQINEDTAFPLVDFCLMTPSSGGYSCLDSDQAGPKHTYTAFIQFDTPADLPEKMTASISSLQVEHTSDLFIQGMLEKYGSRSDLVDVPEVLERYLKNDDPENPEYYTTEDYRNAGVKVLDYKNPLSVRLHKNLELSGIAVADGKLHVQVHYLENAHRSWPTALHSISSVWVNCGFNGNYMDWGSWKNSVSWAVDRNEYLPDYQEFIFPWNPKEGDRPVIRVQITEIAKEIFGNWNIGIPLADVWKGSVTPAEAAASAAKAAPAADPAPYDWQDELKARLRGEPAEIRDLVDKLVPLHSVCEREGIRFELISAAINETAGLAIYSMEDPEGSRINDLSYPIVNVLSPIDDGQTIFPLHYDEAAGKACFATHFKADGKKALDTGSAFRLEAPSLDVCRRSGQSILGLLQKYGSRAKLVEVPEIQERYVKSDGPEGTEFYTTEDLRKAGVKVLDFQNPLSVRLHKNLELSGIGVVGGQLHVQVHYIDNEHFKADGSRRCPRIEFVDVCRTVNGRDDCIHSWNSDIIWNSNKGNWADFQEFIIPWDELAGYRLGIRVYITELVDVVNGNWTAEVPVQDIWAGDSSQESTDEAKEPAGSAFPVSQDYLTSHLYFSPGCQALVKELLPVHRTCESKGIRMEIIAAAMNQANGLVIYSLEDLEGNRINEWSEPTPDIQSTKVGMTRSLLDFDESTGKALYYLAYDFEDPGITDIPAFHLGIMPLDVMRTSERSILGLLQKYGSRAEFTDVPETLSPYPKKTETEPWEYYTIEEYRNEGIRVLDYTKPLSVRLSKDLELSGIGILDGKLHVQLHYINGRWFYVNGIRHPKYGYAHAVRTVNGSEERFFEWNNNLSWDADGDGQDEFKEFIIPWDDPEGTRPGLRISFAENIEVIDGDWSFEIPMQEIWVGEGGPAGA